MCAGRRQLRVLASEKVTTTCKGCLLLEVAITRAPWVTSTCTLLPLLSLLLNWLLRWLLLSWRCDAQAGQLLIEANRKYATGDKLSALKVYEDVMEEVSSVCVDVGQDWREQQGRQSALVRCTRTL